ncbi:hypothetical protein ATE84_2714 [Aquimarina sp. MAR_2010_214]|uniref:hypothetical protein n=1 Tax=Aquimarina sp. MAR_2010_214 TaxID=1250026 RepID=UPI000CB47E24|nr:hypothetical protein [Aquimarina sp. MAR_2010_214]PKV50650.1 hypothetical protein ATE84_2714 [Aquimarina sp. MAR_2010_214]
MEYRLTLTSLDEERDAVVEKLEVILKNHDDIFRMIEKIKPFLYLKDSFQNDQNL